MGSFIIYIIEWTLCLLAFLLLYKMCFSGSTFHRFNRFFLLGSVVVSALLPLIHITTSEQMEPIAEVCRLNTAQFEPSLPLMQLPAAFPIVNPPQDQISEDEALLTTGQKVFIVFALTYLIYLLTQVIGWLRSLVKMMLFLRGKHTRRVGRRIRLVVHHEEYGPFSWMNYIVISDKEDGFGRRASMHHELSHIVLLHFVDLIFILLCTLVNPLCWLVMKEIKIVHEYEADDEVINHYHIRSRDYQRLLVMRTVGAEAYALACSFNLNIKKRIIMMKKKQSHWWRMMWIAVTVPLVGLALTAFSKPKEALKEVADSSVKIIEQPIVNALSSDVIESEEAQVPTPAPVVKVEVVPEVKKGDLISGSITDDKGKPLMLAAVFERDAYGRIVANSMSDKNGHFSLRVVNPKNQLSVSCPGFESQTLDIKEEKMNVVLKGNAKLSGVTVTGVAEKIDANDPRYKEENHEADESDKVYDVVQQMPKFPDGDQGLMRYLSTHLRYPAVAREMQVEGEVTVEFTIDKTGLVRSPRVIEVNVSSPIVTAEVQKAAKEGDEEAIETMKAHYDAIEAMKEEAVYVVRNMPRWEPSRRNGMRFAMDMSIPVGFKLLK